nr:RagB/SusD family nutrient uptake outer membrane protein [Odoribacter splanchnicus]
MKKIFKKTSSIVVGLLMCTACNDWLDVQPSDRIAEKRVFSQVSGFWGALNGVYTELLSPNLYGGFMTTLGVEIMAQRYNVTTNHTTFYDLANQNYNADVAKSQLQNYWNEAYKQILDCNNLLKNAEERRGEVLNDKQYSLIKAEAKALRAFLHFDLLRMFGPMTANLDAEAIPYRETTTMTTSALMSGNDVIQKILKDLTEAEDILIEWDPVVNEGMLMSANDNDHDNDGNIYRFRGLRMNYYAVVALKARVYLWANMRTEALQYAKKIIENPNADDLYPAITRAAATDYSNPDRSFSSEVLFSLLYEKKEDLYNTYFNSSNASSSNKLIPFNQRVDNLFGDDRLTDYRYNWWEASNGIGETNLLMNVRLREISNTDLVYGKLMPLIRVSEMYLIAAECATDELKYDYLNAHRLRRGNQVEVAEELESELAKEYSKEFLCEGQLWFFYKRTNAARIQAGGSNSFLNMSSYYYIPNLPDSEIKYRN